MSSDFARIMTLLRKERKLSQKKAAEDLGVSQGLLSHYEKGKRECGLDFLVRAADYYNVSCDYLLGRSPEPEGKTISVDDIPEDDPNQRDKVTPGSVMIAFNKKLINNSLNVLFSMMTRCGSSTVAVYKMFRYIYSANGDNDENFFMIEKTSSQAGGSAVMSLCESKVAAASSGVSLEGEDAVTDSEDLRIDTRSLADQYPRYYSSMVNLIKNSESRIRKLEGKE